MYSAKRAVELCDSYTNNHIWQKKNFVGFVEEWQTGAFFLLVSALVGIGVGTVIGSFRPGVLALAGIIIGAILTFLLLSYLLYGR